MTGTLSQALAGTYLFESQPVVNLHMEPRGPPKTSLNNYQDKLLNDPE